VKKINNNYLDFLSNVNEKFWNHKPILRYGQAIMYVLKEEWPEKYQEIKESSYDCYYDDSIVERLLNYLESNWKNNEYLL
jgi:hypothetical protein